MVSNYYLTSDSPSNLYKDCYVIYKNLIELELKQANFSTDVQIFNTDLEVNRADLVVIKRVASPQPPNIALLNQKEISISNTQIYATANMVHLYFEFISYGNTFLEAENIGATILGILNSTSINKLRELSNDSIVGHEILNWSETNHYQDTPIFFNSVAVRVTFILTSTIEKTS